MPIGAGFEDFSELKAHLRSQTRKAGKKLNPKRMNAYTAAVAEKIRPGWHKEAAQKAARTRRGEE